MNRFDYSLYEDEEEELPKAKPNIPAIPNVPIKENVQIKEKSPEKKSNFDYSIYDDETQEKPKQETDEIYKKYYKAPEYTKEDLKKMSVQERMQYAQELQTDREYRKSAGFTKSAISDLSFGFSERIDELKPKEDEELKWLGGMVGSTPALLGGFALLGKGLGMMPRTYKWTKNILHTLGAGGIGGTHEAVKQAGKGEDFDINKIAWNAAGMAAFDVAFRGIPGAYNWLKSLTGPQQEALLVKNMIPENMTPSQLKKYTEEIVPELQKVGQAEYENAYKTSMAENDNVFKQEMANVQGKHENDLFKIQQLEAEHAARAKEIEEANQLVMEQFEKSKAEWEATKARENIVKEALESSNKKSEFQRDFKLSEGEDIGIRPESPVPKQTNLEVEVGDVISKEKIKNPTEGGEEATAAIRGSAKADQKEVARLYTASDELNKGIVDSHPEAAQELRGIVEHLERKGNLTPQEQEILTSAETTLERLIKFDESGNAIGFNEVDNQFLLDQAKVLRNQMYYDYGESNATGVYTPLVDLYQDAARRAAVDAGNTAAATANDVARTAHREWATLYKNKYIRQWRNVSKNTPTNLYESALGIDNFRQINRVLSRTNSGQNLSQKIRRDLINKKLEKFYKNPKGTSLDEFNEVLDNLDPILESGERSKISNLFRQSRKSETKPILSKKIEPVKEPIEPKLEKVPEKKISKPSLVRIPTKKPVPTTPAMKEASKLMEITEDKAMKMADSPSGLKYLKEKLSGSSKGERLFQEIQKNKVGEILYRKNYKGSELNEIVQKNYDVLSEILGESHADELLKSSEQIGEGRVTREALLKFSKNFGFIKALSLLGVI